jgi:hypothetical protein
MFIARNNVLVASGYSPDATFTMNEEEPAEKVTIRVLLADVIMQITERHPILFTDSFDTETYLERGFHTVVPIVAFTAIRFRAVTPTNANIHVRFYGSGTT